MPRSSTKETASDAPKSGSVVRTIGTLVPLAVAVAGGALQNRPAGLTGSQTAFQSASQTATVQTGNAPVPLLAKGQPVDWFFVFKLNASAFPMCGEPDSTATGKNETTVASTGEDTRTCPFGGDKQTDKYPFGQRFVYASNIQPNLTPGGAPCMGTSTDDPVGATYDEVFNGHFHYLIWNDQFHDLSPAVQNCSGGDCGAPWGHSKGMLAWNDAGEGLVMQVSTPSWPGTGSSSYKTRAIGDTLGCIKGDDDVSVSQHFFALHLTKADLLVVLRGLQEASVVTDVPPGAGGHTQYADIGSDPDILAEVGKLGVRSHLASMDSATTGHEPAVTLSSGVKFIAKPSLLSVPPWQMISSVLGGENLRVASWWGSPEIYSTNAGVPGCWDKSLPTPPGAVEIAKSGTWDNVSFSLIGNPAGNHAKVGVATSGSVPYSIFGDENQQGSIDPKNRACTSSQNERGGTFYVLDNAVLADNVKKLIAGDSAPVQ